MDEAIEGYTKRVIGEYNEYVDYINKRYSGPLYIELRSSINQDHKNIAFGKIMCLKELNHITREEEDRLVKEVRGVV